MRKKPSKKSITEKTILAKIFKKKGALSILTKYQLPCLVCPMIKFEIEKLTIGQVSRMYHLDLKKLLSELNDLR